MTAGNSAGFFRRSGSGRIFTARSYSSWEQTSSTRLKASTVVMSTSLTPVIQRFRVRCAQSSANDRSDCHRKAIDLVEEGVVRLETLVAMPYAVLLAEGV